MHSTSLKYISYLSAAFLGFTLLRCAVDSPVSVAALDNTPQLTQSDVQQLIAQAVDLAQQNGQAAVIAVADRWGNPLAVFSMTGTAGSEADPNFGAIAKARTAAMLSSNYAALSTLTACWITRATFPPNQPNTLLQGPLFGVGFSSLTGSDIYDTTLPGQNNPGQPGLTGVPGGFPIYKGDLLAGGLGVSTFSNAAGLPANFLMTCGGNFIDEAIAQGAASGFAASAGKTANNIQLDGIQLAYSNSPAVTANFTLTPADLANLGSFNPNYPVVNPKSLPVSGYVNGYQPQNGSLLATNEIQQIITQAITEANRIRSTLRRPVGLSARFSIAVTDIDGTVLALYRMADAPVFSTDVCVQKARTAAVYSDPNSNYGNQIRAVLGLSAGQQIAFSTRAIGFLAGPYYPPGKGQPSNGLPVQPGPLYVIDPVLPTNFNRLQQNQVLNPLGNGMTLFGGGVPLYKNGQLAGAIGVSGDGVRPDDMVAVAGAAGFQPPVQIQADQYFYQGVRLPYVTFERNVYIK